ncbi:unnamed protein product [Cuscuta europaea]|uniref:Uncharacterized protein n=1 Tax=Cuscuta europaea TaxID=41803 RepID=A0A9P0YWN2_CUSEU|nr:unnamed protein product [Cuscuta europaea]
MDKLYSSAPSSRIFTLATIAICKDGEFNGGHCWIVQPTEKAGNSKEIPGTNRDLAISRREGFHQRCTPDFKTSEKRSRPAFPRTPAQSAATLPNSRDVDGRPARLHVFLRPDELSSPNHRNLDLSGLTLISYP